MLNRINLDSLRGVLLIALIFFLLEISINGGEIIIQIFLSSLLLFFGKRMIARKLGKVLFWFGLISLIITIISMFTFRFFLIALLVLIILQYFRSKEQPEHLHPQFKDPLFTFQNEPILKNEPLFKNVMFGPQKTPDHVYEWNDINIQRAIGDTVIDLSFTVLPKGEAVIVIRHLVGNVRILVPYEIEVSVHHSIFAGRTTILENKLTGTYNQNIHYQTPEYNLSTQKVKIVTSMISGDLEVKRI